MEINQWALEIAVLLLLIFVAVFHPRKIGHIKDFTTGGRVYNKYWHWQLLTLCSLFILVPLMAFGISKAFQYLMMLEMDTNPRVKYQIYISPDMWLIPAGLLALGLLYFPTQLLYKLLSSKATQAEFSPFLSKEDKDDVNVIRWFALITASIVLIMVFLMSDYYIRIWNHKVEINAFNELSVREYNFNQIKKITYVEYSRYRSKYSRDTNTIVENPHHHILFKDGYLWDSDEGTYKIVKEKEIISFLSNRSNVHVDTLWVDNR